jgi:IMP dehydrogenase
MTKDKFTSSEEGLSFNDVLIIPSAKSNVESRLDTDLTTQLTKDITIKVPIIASPMDRVVDLKVAHVMAQHGAIACFHRFQTVEQQLTQVILFSDQREHLDNPFKEYPMLAAIAAQLDDPTEAMRIKSLGEAFLNSGRINAFVIDTAMGTNTKVLRTIEYLNKTYNSHSTRINIIAGNVVSADACTTLINAGVHGIRVGIGSGSRCLTRMQTGVGRGQITALLDCASKCRQYDISIISDGGHYSPGDVAKALAAGANVVMMGSPLAAHEESPGPTYCLIDGDYVLASKLRNPDSYPQYKEYRGMASKEAQVEWRGELKAGTTYEGKQDLLKVKGPLQDTLTNYIGGIRSAMTYVGASTLEQFYENSKFEKLSLGAQKESYER